jgi:hypothetical protein
VPWIGGSAMEMIAGLTFTVLLFIVGLIAYSTNEATNTVTLARCKVCDGVFPINSIDNNTCRHCIAEAEERYERFKLLKEEELTDKELKEKELKEKELKEKELKEKELKEKELKEKKRMAKSNLNSQTLKPITNIVERAQIANKAILSYPIDQLEDVLELLKNNNEIIEAVDIFNEQIRGVYLELLKPIMNSYKATAKNFTDAQVILDLDKCMELGRDSVLYKLKLEPPKKPEGSVMKSSIISNTHSWDQLKDDF